MAELTHSIHLISLTHWDREWRFPFEETRMLLVEMIDGLLDLLDREPKYKHYHLDGHCVLVEDYLAARCENRDRLLARIREGRILIGPWYTLPATCMVCGESLIRNFLIGAEVCEQYGPRMAVGYTPAGYGQPSQFPQILRNFGIDSALFYRGINRAVCPDAEYWWDSPDGSRVLGFRLGDYARANFFYFVYRPVVLNRDNTRMTHHWEDGGLPVRLCDGQSTTCYHVLEPAGDFHPENLPRALATLDSEEIRGTTTPCGLAMQCDDSVEPHEAEVRIIDEANRVFGHRPRAHRARRRRAERADRRDAPHAPGGRLDRPAAGRDGQPARRPPGAPRQRAGPDPMGRAVGDRRLEPRTRVPRLLPHPRLEDAAGQPGARLAQRRGDGPDQPPDGRAEREDPDPRRRGAAAVHRGDPRHHDPLRAGHAVR
jgi:hypothetical protein